MIDVITIGETMLLMVPGQSGPLRYVSSFNKAIGGAESAVAIALTRLGHSAGWISRLGKDEFGLFIYNFLRGEGVDVSQVMFDENAPTGLFFKERRAGNETRVVYYRQDSAASHMCLEDINFEYLQQAKYIHITGITPALSTSCNKLIWKVVEFAKTNGIGISFDPNIRLKLWDIVTARSCLTELAQQCDVFFPGEQEMNLLYPDTDLVTAAHDLLSYGVKKVVIKQGAKGALVVNHQGQIMIPGYSVETVDPIGAGDGFAAGFLAGQLKMWDDAESAKLANAVGAMAVTVAGDIEGYPTLEEVMHFTKQKVVVER